MKIASIADIHARGKNLDQLAAQLAAVTEACDRENVEAMLIPGDIFDRPGVGDQHASTGAICEVVCGWAAKFEKPIHAVPGNHDLAGSGSKDALHVLDEIKNVYVAHQPEVCSLGSVFALFVPWMWSGSPSDAIQSVVDFMKSGKEEAKIILVAHIQVVGSIIQGRQTCEAKPGSWQVTREFLESLPVDRFFLGDFHRRQPDLIPGRGGYVGALRQLNYGEEGNPAGVEIWNSETNEVKWIELEAAKKYVTISCKPGDESDYAESLLSAQQDKTWNIRARYDGIIPEPVFVRELEDQGVEVQVITTRHERLKRADVPTGILDNKHELIGLYARNQSPPWNEDRIAAARGAYDELVGGGIR